MEERAKKIIEACLVEKSKNPIEIFGNIAKKDFIRMHGPEHHILDGAALLTAFFNARWETGKQIPDALTMLEIAKVLNMTINEVYGMEQKEENDICTFT